MNVALYIRVSTQEQAIHGLSVETQRSNLEKWAEQNHARVVGVYADEGISARKPASKRPALQQLLEDVRLGKIELVIFTKLDRWFRSVSEYYKVQEVLEQHHVNWKTIHEDYDTSTAAGRLKINIMLSVAQDEADRTSERIKVVFETKRQKLEPLTGSCPLGYRIEGKRYVKDPEKAPAIEAFFRKYMACGSVSYTQAYIEGEYGLSLSYQTVNKMLKNTAYYGRYFGIDGMCPPLITREEYEKVQSMRRRCVRKTKENRVYLFSGLIVCGECGRHMDSGINRNPKHQTPIYHCQDRYFGNTRCSNGVCPSEKKIEEHIMGSLEARMKRYKVDVMNAWERDSKKSYKAEITAARNRLGKLKELFLNDLISMEEYKADRAELEEKLNALLEKEKPKEKPNFDLTDKLLVNGWQDDYAKVSRAEQREFWRVLVKEIRIYADRHIEYDLNV